MLRAQSGATAGPKIILAPIRRHFQLNFCTFFSFSSSAHIIFSGFNVKPQQAAENEAFLEDIYDSCSTLVPVPPNDTPAGYFQLVPAHRRLHPLADC